MMSKNTKMLAQSMMVMTSMTTMSCSNPMSMWMLTEMSSLMFIFMIMKSMNMNNTPIIFISQALSSSSFLVGITLNSSLMMSVGATIKMGMFPFHTWPPLVAMKLSWKEIALLNTTMKVPSLMFINMYPSNTIMISSAVLTAITSLFKAMHLSNLKMIVTLSSMMHSGWLILTILIIPDIWILYFTIYMIFMLIICSMLKKKIKSTLYLKMMIPKERFMMLMSMMAFVGLPPWITFIPKALSTNMIPLPLGITISILLITSSWMFIPYLRIMLKTLISYPPSPKIKMLTTKQPSWMMVTPILILMFMLIV